MKVQKPMFDTLRATGTCFDDALIFFTKLWIDDGICTHFLVHGIAERNGGIFSHAWVELDEGGEQIVSDFGFVVGGSMDGQKVGYTTLAADYYEYMGISDTTKYSLKKVPKLALNDSGPWEEKYQALTVEGKRK